MYRSTDIQGGAITSGVVESMCAAVRKKYWSWLLVPKNVLVTSTTVVGPPHKRLKIFQNPTCLISLNIWLKSLKYNILFMTTCNLSIKEKKMLNILPSLTYSICSSCLIAFYKEREGARLEYTVCPAPNPSSDTQRQGKDEATYPPFMVHSLFLGKRWHPTCETLSITLHYAPSLFYVKFTVPSLEVHNMFIV